MTPRPRPEILDIHAYTPGLSAIRGADRVTKLSSNEGAFGPPPSVAAALAALDSQLHRYPDGGATALRCAIGARFGLDPDRIICGNGSDDLIFLLCQTYGGAGAEMIMTEHGFSIFDIAGRLAGCRVIKVQERDRTADVDAILDAVSLATRMVFIANPNNPTGTFLSAAETARLRGGLPPEVLLVLDAAYAEYVDRPDYNPGTALVALNDNTVMTRTFSKIFALGGLRLGWAYGPPGVVENLNRIRAPFNVSLLAQKAGIAALAEVGWVERSLAHNTAERSRVTGVLQRAGIEVTPSEANFILADLGSEARAGAADAHLRTRGLIVRRVNGFGLPTCLRVTIGTAGENDLLLAALTSFTEGTI